MATSSPPPLRSWLFVPGSRPDRMAKALSGEAHAVILDLEDAVALSEKAAARQAVRDVVAAATHAQCHVRINALSTAFAFADLAAIVPARPTGIMLPKTESVEDVIILDWLIAQHERDAGLHAGSVEILPILETARGVAAAAEIARSSPRLRRLAFGAGDFTLDLGLYWSRDEAELLPHRSAIALASRAAGIEQPLDAVWVHVGDGEGMAASASRAVAHGFQGKLCIHPTQITTVHAAYRPDPAAVAQARRIVAAFDAAESAATAAIQIDGKLIDYPIVEAARRLLADAER